MRSSPTSACPQQPNGGDRGRPRYPVQTPSVGVVVLSQYVNSLYALELFRNGTSGLAYLLKDRVGELRGAIEGIARGHQRRIGDRSPGRRGTAGPSPATRRLLLDTLTSREMEVLSEMAQGKSNAAIAESLFISQSAIEKHINSIFAKLALSAEDGAHHRRCRSPHLPAQPRLARIQRHRHILTPTAHWAAAINLSYN